MPWTGAQAVDRNAAAIESVLADTAELIAAARQGACLWRDTEAVQSQATRMAQRGDEGRARELSLQAARQARLALEQCHLEHARYALKRIDPERLDVAAQSLYRQLQMAIGRHDAEAASRLLAELQADAVP